MLLVAGVTVVAGAWAYSSRRAEPVASVQRGVPVVRLVTREYGFDVPARMTAGLVRLRVVNRGTVPHYARIVRLDSAKTLADFNAWRRAGGRPPAWFVPAGGPAPIAPGDSADAAVVLRPGRHIVFCTYPLKGGESVHLDSGMVREVMVTGTPTAPNASISSLTSDATIVLGDFAFDGASEFRAGVNRVRVVNAGRLAHQALLIRLPDGVPEGNEMAWFRRSYVDTRPGRPSGGLLELRAGESGWFSVSLRPGRYLLLCNFTDRAVRHFDKGMVRLVTVKG